MSHAITLLDGAAGTALWAMADARGIPRRPVWQYNLIHPELVSYLAARYADAGSEILQANTFCANATAAAAYPGFRAEPAVTAGVKLAKAAAGGRARVALDLGPLETVPADRAERLEAAAVYDEQIGAGADAGADLIFLQTFWELSLLVLAAERAAQYGLPLFCAMTFGADGATFGGVTPEAMVRLLAPYHPAAVGLNCSPGPAAAAGVLEAFRRCTDLPLICKPNMPPEHDPEDFARAMGPALELADYAGGCCGTTPEDIAALGRRLGK